MTPPKLVHTKDLLPKRVTISPVVKTYRDRTSASFYCESSYNQVPDLPQWGVLCERPFTHKGNYLVWNIIWLINITDFKTLNIWYTETICPIDFKLRESIVQVNGILYTNFQAILNFHKNNGIFSFKGHRHLLWSCKYTNKLKDL